MFASRLLWYKGVAEFVDAARLVRAATPEVRFVIVGKPDSGNRTAIPVPQLEAWTRDGIVEWWGHRDDMPAVLQAATIFVLPTWYREGLPKVLLEAAATGRAIVATDMPGCREIVRPRVNGILVSPKDGAAVARAIQTLLGSPELRQRFGRAGRRIAVSEFSEEMVVEHTLEVYRAILGERWPRSATNGRNGNAPSGRDALR
jgi:glycosyltransferase involved in cell wall biosynthesis